MIASRHVPQALAKLARGKRPVAARALAGRSALLRRLRQDEGNNEAVETERLGENENEDHSDEERRLLSVGTDTGVADDSNRHTGRQAREPAGEARGEVRVTVEVRVLRLGTRNSLDEDNRDNEPVDAQHTRHNHGNNVFHHNIAVHDTHRHDADARLGRAVCRAEVCGKRGDSVSLLATGGAQDGRDATSCARARAVCAPACKRVARTRASARAGDNVRTATYWQRRAPRRSP